MFTTERPVLWVLTFSYFSLKIFFCKGQMNSQPVIDAVEGFNKLKVVHPYCQKCLGGSTRFKSFVNRVGSIIIWKYLKGFFYKTS